MLNLPLLLFDNHKEAAVFFMGFLAYIAVLSFLAYRQTETNGKKDVLAFMAVFGSLAIISLAVSVYFSYIS